MSRETDSPSSGPNGRGGAAYPSGTPPYGTPTASDGGPGAGRTAAQPEDRKTETTLTTRIRINIPGSRPIPPVVVRKPVSESEGAEDGTDAEAPVPGAGMSTGAVEAPAEPAPAPAEKSSDWFAPRKSGPAKGGQGGGSTNGAGTPGSSGAPRAGGSGGGASGGAGGGGVGTSAGMGAGAAVTGGARSGGGAGAGRPGGVVGAMNMSGGSRPGGTNGAGFAGATGGPVAPGHGGGTGSFDVTDALGAGPLGGGARAGEPRRDELPYFSENGEGAAGAPGGQNGQGAQQPDQTMPPNGYGGGGQVDYGPQGQQGPHSPSNGQNAFHGQGGYVGQGQAGPGVPGGGRFPAGPTGGPVTGDSPLTSPPGAGADAFGGGHDFNSPDRFDGSHDFTRPDGPGAPGAPGVPPGPEGFGNPRQGNPGQGNPHQGGPGQGGPGPGTPGSGRPDDTLGGLARPNGPTGPTGLAGAPGAPVAGPHTGLGPGEGPGGPGGLSDDTAILTPQKPAPEPGTPGFGGAQDNVSGHTLTSGIPVVPPADRNATFGVEPPAPGGPRSHTPPKSPDAATQDAPAAPAPAKPAKKGRSKLALLAVGVIMIGGFGYGAGLLMNRSDVPKGTTVLGVDIGGGTRDDAVEKLNAAFDSRVNKDLKLSVDGRSVTLKPEQAGLQFDMQATASTAAHSDYNPVSVVGSLFGNHRTVDPVMPVDEEKLHAELRDVTGGAGSATDGTIEFKNGKAVAVYGKAGKGVDVDRSATVVEDAYRTQVETGTVAPVTLATTTRQPTISDAEVDRVMKEFAEPAMSGLVTIQTDAAHSIQFGPVSLPKILGFKPVDGKLVETYDLDALKEAYGTTFDGVQVETATGTRGILPEDVVSALRTALRGKTAEERTGVIDTSPN